MAMTKKEQLEVANLKAGIRHALAMNWPLYPKPQHTSPEVIKERLGDGLSARTPLWYGNGYTGTVSLGSTGMVSHTREGDHGCGTQNMGRGFDSELDALMWTRHEMTERFANLLAAVDEKIEFARAKEGGA